MLVNPARKLTINGSATGPTTIWRQPRSRPGKGAPLRNAS